MPSKDTADNNVSIEQRKAISEITGGWLSTTLWDYDLPHTNGDIAWRTRKMNSQLEKLLQSAYAAGQANCNAKLKQQDAEETWYMKGYADGRVAVQAENTSNAAQLQQQSKQSEIEK